MCILGSYSLQVLYWSNATWLYRPNFDKNYVTYDYKSHIVNPSWQYSTKHIFNYIILMYKKKTLSNSQW